MTIRGVLFDFSGTLFALEPWFDAPNLDAAARRDLLRKMTTPVGEVARLSGELQEVWNRRDLDPDLHRTAYLAVLDRSGLSPEQAEALYARLTDPLTWTPYPDAEAALKGVTARGLAVGVISNIAFDIRPAFTSRGWDGYVSGYALSFEQGAIKPDPVLFEVAIDQLGLWPSEVLKVGDSAEADGGAQALGCAFALVEPKPTDERPDGLLAALRHHDVVGEANP